VIANHLDAGVLILLLVGIGVVVVTQLWTLLSRLHDLSGQLSYIAHLLVRGSDEKTDD